MSNFEIVSALFGVWLVLTGIKAAVALAGHKEYVYAWWDGGSTRKGRALSKRVTQLRLGLGVVGGGACAVLAAGMVEYRIGLGILIAIVALDFLATWPKRS